MRARIAEANPTMSKQARATSTGQGFKFRTAVQPGDRVVTYDSAKREYLLGTVTGPYEYRPGLLSKYEHIHRVNWEQRVSKDVLAKSSNNSLGAILSLFEPGQDVLTDIEDAIRNKRTAAPPGRDQSLGQDTPSFDELFADFRNTYLNSEQGSYHQSSYEEAQQSGRENYNEVTQAKAAGDDVTDLILRKLLPHTDTKTHRAAGQWIHVAPAITGDIRTWYEAAGLAKPDDWPAKAALILEFFEGAATNPDRLDEVCRHFAERPLSKGLQSGMLTPMLNALRPHDFCVFNSKVAKTLTALREKQYRTAIADYPRANAAVRKFLAEHRETITEAANGSSLNAQAIFDMFCHWLESVRDSGEEEEGTDEGARSLGSIDRRSASDAARVIERICPDPAPRASAIAECARVIRDIHARAPSAWSVTLHRDRVRISSGGVIAIEMKRDGVYVVVHEPSIDPAVLSAVKPFDKDENLKWVEGADGYRIPYSDLKPALSLLRPANQELIRRAAEKSAKAPFSSAHSPGVLDYFRQQGEVVPDPGFYSRPEPVKKQVSDGVSPQYPPPKPSYLIEDFANETSIARAEIEGWIHAVNRKGQAILYGPPGTGKTFVAERLARLLAGTDGFIDLVQFHPAYAYEDFIQGLRPQARKDGSLEFVMVPGRFMIFCEEAAKRTGTSVLVIDEINRANLPQVLGELMYLLEYRDREIPLAGGGRLRIPPRVLIIGTMNTADRSIALVDHALRRRFAFVRLEPKFEILERFHAAHGTDATGLVSVLKRLNGEIRNAHYSVGISFFMRESLRDDLPGIWANEIEPYLEEYFFDKPEAVEAFRWERISADAGY